MKFYCFLKLTLIFFGIFLLPCVNVAQKEMSDDILLGKHINPKFEKKEKKLNNPLGLDFQLFGTSIHYANKIKGSFFWGIEGGLLPDLFDWVILAGRDISEENTVWSSDKSEAHLNSFDQLIFGHVFIRLKPESQYFEIDAGFRAAVYTRSGSEVDDLGLTNFYGGYVKPLFGNKKIKAGVRIDVGNAKGSYYGPEKEFIVIMSPLIRINFR